MQLRPSLFLFGMLLFSTKINVYGWIGILMTVAGALYCILRMTSCYFFVYYIMSVYQQDDLSLNDPHLILMKLKRHAGRY